VQRLLVDAEVVRDLVHHGDGHLAHHVLDVAADLEDRVLVDRDPSGSTPP
jgi:hypothetical protein